MKTFFFGLYLACLIQTGINFSCPPKIYFRFPPSPVTLSWCRAWYVSTIRCASIFDKYGTLAWYAFFVMVGYGTLVSYLNLNTNRTKRTVSIGTVRFMCNLRRSLKIRATVHDLHNAVKNTRYSTFCVQTLFYLIWSTLTA